MTKFIFVTGGVVSSLGKGITTSAIGALLKASGYHRLRFVKLDPYLNYDPGTMNPFEHGEVYVANDGTEADLDLGTYERFTDINTVSQDSNITSGKIYTNLLNKERHGNFLGSTVQIVPHVTDEIKRFIGKDRDNYDFVLCEVGGTVGDIEANPMIEAIRQFRYENEAQDTVSVHVTLVPMIKAAKELKTKPTQRSVQDLRERGIIPDFIVCRTEHPLPDRIREKVAKYSNLPVNRIIEGIDVDTVYRVPLYYHQQSVAKNLLTLVGLESKTSSDGKIIDMERWVDLESRINATNSNESKTIILSIVGKYVPYDDAYKSIVEAVHHASWYHGIKVNINWIDSKEITEYSLEAKLRESQCVIVPGGFGTKGTFMKLLTLKYCREMKIPVLGICLGMQIMVVEFLRNVIDIKNVISSEWLTKDQRQNPDIVSKHVFAVGFIEEWQKEGETVNRKDGEALGGTMRLGKYTSFFEPNSRIAQIYESSQIDERHRHRYEINGNLLTVLEDNGMSVSGKTVDGLAEVVEIKERHPYYIGCQFHPEFTSSPFKPHPLFKELVWQGFEQLNKK